MNSGKTVLSQLMMLRSDFQFQRCVDHYKGPSFRLDIDNMVYAFDSTTIDLCLSLFPWAKFRKTKGVVKRYTVLDLRGSIPIYVNITNANVHDVNILDTISIEAGSYYIMDKGYTDFNRLYKELFSGNNNLNKQSDYPFLPLWGN